MVINLTLTLTLPIINIGDNGVIVANGYGCPFAIVAIVTIVANGALSFRWRSYRNISI